MIYLNIMYYVYKQKFNVGNVNIMNHEYNIMTCSLSRLLSEITEQMYVLMSSKMMEHEIDFG